MARTVRLEAPVGIRDEAKWGNPADTGSGEAAIPVPANFDLVGQAVLTQALVVDPVGVVALRLTGVTRDSLR